MSCGRRLDRHGNVALLRYWLSPPATHDLWTVTFKRVQFHFCFLCRIRTKNTWVSQRFPTRCTASLSRRASTSRSWLQVRNLCSSARVKPSGIPPTLFLTDVLALKGSLAWESPPWSTASSSQICTKIGSCSTPKVRPPQRLAPRTFAFHDRIPKTNFAVCPVCRANHANGRNHQTHGGYRRERRQTQAHHRGHSRIRRRCEQH